MQNLSSSFVNRTRIYQSSDHILSNSSVNFLERQALMQKSQRNYNQRNFLYSTSPSLANKKQYEQGPKFYKRSSVCDLKKSIYPTTQVINGLNDQQELKSLQQIKKKLVPSFIQRQNKVKNQKNPRYRYSQKENIISASLSLQNENLSNFKQLNHHYPENIFKKPNDFKTSRTSFKDNSHQQNILSQKLNIREKSSELRENSKNKGKTFSMHTRFSSTYTHLHENIKSLKQSKNLAYTIDKLSFSQSQVAIQLQNDSQNDEQVQNTARFNAVQQKKQTLEGELQLSTTSLQKNIVLKYRNIKLSEFLIGPCKGKGRYGKVYQVIHKKTGCIFALKQIAINQISKMIEQFILEIKIQSFLKHPYITKLYGYFVQNNNFYLIMEYMNEGSLFDLIKKQGCLSQVETSSKLFQVGQALCMMHRYNLIHRDIKPQNIVMTFNVCKICDFSWATRCLQRRQTNCGTLDYLSPEVIQGNKYTNSIDLWSFGVLLYELLVGKPPFYNVSCKQTLNKIKQCKFSFPIDLSQTSRDLIQSILKKDPQQRNQIDQILRHSFFQQKNQ